MGDCLVSRLSSLLLLLCFLILSFTSLSLSLEVISSSPCQSVCAASTPRTNVDEVVCFDNDFTSTSNGTTFQRCVECELGSTAVDAATGATDVTWGLYNLRYALSTCVFSFPVRKIYNSSPCSLVCDPLEDGIRHNLNSNATVADLSYCNFPSFQDTPSINRCAECYGRMDGQAYLANFLQTLHIACLQPPSPSQSFPVAANTIFNATLMAPPTPSTSTVAPTSKPLNLALVVALPVVFGVLFLAAIIGCCFYSARHRRRIMAQRNAMRRVQAQSSPSFPADHPQYQEYQQKQAQFQSPQGFESAPLPEPIYFSPIADRKENPYIQSQPYIQPQPYVPPQAYIPPQQPQPCPSYPAYSPADYAPHAPPNFALPVPIDTSQIGPGPDQKKVHTLHDQYFPPPPPPPPSQPLTMPSPPQPPPLPQEGVESLHQHHMKTPSLGIPVPRSKKSLDVQRRQREEALKGLEARDAIQLQDYKPAGAGGLDVGKEGEARVADHVESPQVFVYDPVNGRYVKEQ